MPVKPASVTHTSLTIFCFFFSSSSSANLIITNSPSSPTSPLPAAAVAVAPPYTQARAAGDPDSPLPPAAPWISLLRRQSARSQVRIPLPHFSRHSGVGGERRTGGDWRIAGLILRGAAGEWDSLAAFLSPAGQCGTAAFSSPCLAPQLVRARRVSSP